jgi:MFS family permease
MNDLGLVSAPAQAAEARAWPSPAVAWYAVSVMVLTTVFAQLDLNIVSLLVPSIKKDLHLTDFQLSLLLGFAFAVFYTLVALPIARYIDRYSRKMILALGVAVWSLGTAFCGLAQGFAQLFIARVLVGAGESINGPASYSMVADYFPREKLPRAIAALVMGSLIGSGVALLIGAFVVHAVLEIPDSRLWGIGIIHGWQRVFLAVGLPGLLVALLAAVTVREPPRRGPVDLRAGTTASFAEVLIFLRKQWPIFVPMFAGLALTSLSQGSTAWLPTFFMRTYGWSPAKVGMLTGSLSLILMPPGLIFGVRLAERLAARGRNDAALRVALIGRLISMPAPIVAPLMPDPWLAMAFTQLSLFAIAFSQPSQNAALQIVTPNHMRARVTALYFFIFSIVGTGIGPSLVAAVTDFVFHSDSMLRYSLALTAGFIGPLSLVIMWLGLKPYDREVTRLKALESPQNS